MTVEFLPAASNRAQLQQQHIVVAVQQHVANVARFADHTLAKLVSCAVPAPAHRQDGPLTMTCQQLMYLKNAEVKLVTTFTGNVDIRA